MTRLLLVEVRRALARRLVRVLVGLALLALAIVAISVFLANEDLPSGIADPGRGHVFDCAPAQPFDAGGASSGAVVCEPLPSGTGTTNGSTDDPRFLTAQWPEGSETEGYLMIPAFFLVVTAFVAGASMVGAEWRAGTVTTLLTWEPRRTRVLVARLLASAGLATIIAGLLSAAFLAAFLPTVLVKGTTAGADGEFWRGVVGMWARTGVAAGLAAALGGVVASVGRNTSAAIAVAFAWFAVAENVVSGVFPSLQRWMVSPNLAIFLTGGRVEGLEFDRGAAAALALVATYCIGAVLVAAAEFSRRDVAGAT